MPLIEDEHVQQNNTAPYTNPHSQPRQLLRKQSQHSDFAQQVIMSHASASASSTDPRELHNKRENRPGSESLGYRMKESLKRSGVGENVEVKPQPNVMARDRGMIRDGVGVPLSDTPGTTAPNSPRMAPSRQGSGTNTPRIRPTTLDIPGLTRSKVSPDGRISQRDLGAKLVIVMVGLPARGKSYITKKLARYLNWLQHDTKIFNVGERRRVAAGGPNRLSKTMSQSERPKDLIQHGSTATSAPTGTIDQKEHLDGPTLAANILINGVPGLVPETPNTERSFSVYPEESAVEESPGQQDNRRRDPNLLDEELPELQKTSTTEELPDTEAMDQTASFFDPANKRAAQIREQVALQTLDDLLDFILEQNGSIGIIDATNSTLERRKLIMRRIRERAGPELNVLFLESLCLDENLLEANMRLKLSGPDYKDKDPIASLEDFKKRVKIYEKNYVPLGKYEEDNNMPYVQMIDVGRKVISHQIKGFLTAQATYYLLNFNLAPRQIWITRHGESQDNVAGKIGGDSDLSPNGLRYARALTRFIDHQRKEWDKRQAEKLRNSHFPPHPGDASPPNPHYECTDCTDGRIEGAIKEAEQGNGPSNGNFCVWTSMLKRSIQTAQFFDEEVFDIKQMRMLDELNSGAYEGMTYEQIRRDYSNEYELRRKDKLHYRYPGLGGEGYLDIINRVRPVIVELERMTDHVLLIGHRSVARVLLAYFRGLRREEVADLDVPLGMLYSLEPKPYGVDFRAYRYNPDTESFDYVPDFQLQRAKDPMAA